MIPTASWTIVSKNYLAYARTLCDSFKRFNPDMPFYVLLVDELGRHRAGGRGSACRGRWLLWVARTCVAVAPTQVVFLQ